MTDVGERGKQERLERDLALAFDLVDRADAITLRYFRLRNFSTEWKVDASPVTVADREAERAIRDGVAAARPGDGVVGEEYGGAEITASRRWIADPLDGTRS